MNKTVEKPGQYRKHKWMLSNRADYCWIIFAITINIWLKFEKNVQVYSTELKNHAKIYENFFLIFLGSQINESFNI